MKAWGLSRQCFASLFHGMVSNLHHNDYSGGRAAHSGTKVQDGGLPVIVRGRALAIRLTCDLIKALKGKLTLLCVRVEPIEELSATDVLRAVGDFVHGPAPQGQASTKRGGVSERSGEARKKNEVVTNLLSLTAFAETTVFDSTATSTTPQTLQTGTTIGMTSTTPTTWSMVYYKMMHNHNYLRRQHHWRSITTRSRSAGNIQDANHAITTRD
eukprot:3451458-Amphidinium_carterae.1